MDPGKSSSAPRRTRASGGSRSKYAPRACQECRRRRAKCDGQKPSCGRCVARGILCVFTSEADNRGNAPKSYVNMLQARIKLLQDILWLHSIDVDASAAQLDAQRAASAPAAESMSMSLTSKKMHTDLEGTLCLDEPLGETEGSGGEARFFGATSGRLELQPSHSVPTGSPNLEPSPGTEYKSPVKSQLHNRTGLDVNSPAAVTCDELVSPGLKDRLIDLYFEWEQPWCQVVDETLFRQSLRHGGQYSSPLLLYSILAIGSRFSDEAETRTNPADPQTAGRVFAEHADLLLDADVRSPRITTIQALGVLGIYYVAIGSDSLGWLYHGMANRLLLDMGLNLDSATVTGTTSLAPEEIGLRQNIYWSLYCQDKLWASYTGRICTMLDAQGTVPLPLPLPENTPGHERSRYLTSFQRAMATHCQILEKILTSLYAPKRLASASEKRTFFDSCALTLKGWFYSLPQEVKARAAEGTSLSPHAFVLAMVYQTSIVLLAKPFLSRADASGSGKLPNHSDVSRRAEAACLEAAREICLLAGRYREVFGSFRRSPLTVTHCTLTAALVFMFVQGAGEEKTPSFDSQLECCLQTLRELSISWGPPLRYLRTLNRILAGQSYYGPKQSASVTAWAKTQDTSTDTLIFLRERGTGSDTGTDTGISTGHNDMPLAPVIQQDQPDYDAFATRNHEAVNAAEVPSNSTRVPHELWDDNTTQLLNEIGYLDVGAFDALSWDSYSQDTYSYHF